MQVQINLGQPFEYSAGAHVPRFGFLGDVVLVTDPGKTNMAMVIGTPQGTQLAILQFRAPGSAYDTSDYCRDFKAFLREYLCNCSITTFGIEKAISKRGMNHHHSSMVLTEIRANLIDLAYELTGRKPLEINNWSWKYAILPDGYRSQSEKGSSRFLADVFSKYGNADVTDAICMYRYVQKMSPAEYPLKPDAVEKPLSEYKVQLRPLGFPMPPLSRKFVYEPGLTLDQNCAYFTNRTWERGVATLPVSALSLEDIYAHAAGFTVDNSTPTIEVVVVRC